jgi:hypothetical protein
MPPFPPSMAIKKNHKATTPKSKRAFSHAATSVYNETGDEGRAIAAGNAAANKSKAKSRRSHAKR